MPSTRTVLSATLVALYAFVTPSLGQTPVEGCFDNFGKLKNYGPAVYQTRGSCHDQCFAANKAVFAVTKGQFCFCGDAIPKEGKVPDSQCNKVCQGFGEETCGGDTTWVFGYTGALPPSVPDVETSTTSSSSTSASKTKLPETVQTTVVVSQGPATVTSDPKAQNDTVQGQPKSTTSKAGIAAGVVVSVIAVIAIGVGAFLIVRRNRRLRAEEEYRAAVAAKEFTATIRKPANDSRLDPVMVQHRRLSDGSIADNQDFSRRILKVTNPDGL